MSREDNLHSVITKQGFDLGCDGRPNGETDATNVEDQGLQVDAVRLSDQGRWAEFAHLSKSLCGPLFTGRFMITTTQGLTRRLACLSAS